MKEKFIKINNLSVDKILADFIDNELLLGTNISPKKFWDGFDKVVHELAPKNRELLEIRETIQKEIDLWHKKNKFEDFNLEDYKKFLKDIDYLKEEGSEFKIETKNLDTEISSIAGPQLVVPIMNARYSLNAANARWMSLYDSLYGTDVIESEESGSEKYDPLRGEQVINYARDFLNKHFPINGISWREISGFEVHDGNLKIKKDIYTPSWELYAETDVGIKYYVDTKSYFERNDNKYVITMQDTSTQGTDFRSLSMYFEIDCEKFRARPVRIFGYSGLMGDGDEVELSEKSDNIWMYATAGTPNGVLLDIMCEEEEE